MTTALLRRPRIRLTADAWTSGRARRAAAALLAAAVLSSCAVLFPKEPGIGTAIPWDKLPGWLQDRHAEAWPTLLASCARLGRQPEWAVACDEALWRYTPDDADARRFFERHFEAREMVGGDGRTEGLITGYYEPLLDASLEPGARFRFPLYRRPDSLLAVDLGSLYPELRGRPVRGRLEGGRVVPFYSRGEIDADGAPLAGHELAWVDDPVALFILQVQGSGRLRLPDGRELAVGYADQNGHPYVSIGRVLIERGALAREEVSLFSIRAWLRDNPQEVEAVLHSNPSYIFFAAREADASGPLGSLNVPLTAERAVAVDLAHIRLGLPVWLDTTLPGDSAPFRRLMFAHDTGGAIKGQVRADVFFGRGERAERLAGTMKQAGRLYVLVPKNQGQVASGK
ncbi:MAG TPA: murein transglycosylase A [Acidiferrobacterales bacterium]